MINLFIKQISSLYRNSYEPPKRGRKKGAYPTWYERKIWTCKSCPVEESLIEGIEALIEHRKLHHDEKELFRYDSISFLGCTTLSLLAGAASSSY